MKHKFFIIILLLGVPLTFLASLWLKFVKKAGTGVLSEKIFMHLGILPILDHYYQPMINPKKYLIKSLRVDRELKEIDFNTSEQLDLLNKFKYNQELIAFPINKINDTSFYYNNSTYCSGDAEYLYSMVRHFKPNSLIEVGSGYSTLMVSNAIKKK